MTLTIPEFALVVLVGPSGSGKSTFARTHFRPTEVLSSDACRAWVSDDENDLSVTADAFEVLHTIVAKRLKHRRLTVVDATNVQAFARKSLVALAREYHCLPVAVVLNLPEAVCQERNAQRTDRSMGRHVVRNQRRDLKRSLKGLRREGFRYVYTFQTPEEVAEVTIERTRLWTDRRHEHGPFDLIGDVHGCLDELHALLAELGYADEDGVYRHPAGRQACFVGDLVDRGPNSLGVVELVRTMVEAGTGLCVPGNHDIKLMRKLRGRKVQVRHGLETTLAELDALPPEERTAVANRTASFIDSLVSHFVLDDGQLVVAHVGLKETMHGRASRQVRDFALYGETTGATDALGLPVRLNWAADYRGQAAVVYGHTPVPRPEWLNNTLNIDTGCVFGGRLTALRYPERELVSVPAARTYAEPARPFQVEHEAGLTAQQAGDAHLDLSDVTGKLLIETRLRRTVTVQPEQSAAALEVMSRFAADPRWLIYLPPTMSPSETSEREGMLEHPAEAFAYYQTRGAAQVVCEEKHMGSRAVVVICRDADGARQRFGVDTGEAGLVYTRTGRRFFDDSNLEHALLARLRTAMDQTGFWSTFSTDWACFDAELMPWSVKAQALLQTQYAATGAAARAA
ncbi:MAG: polynucleotide kinase-phosphatase, partial [Bacteroidota bacterium]